MALKRLGKKDLSRGWEAWEAKYYEKVRKAQMLAGAAARLSKPKLVASFKHWSHDWESTARAETHLHLQLIHPFTCSIHTLFAPESHLRHA